MPKLLRAIHPSAAIAAKYKKKLLALVDEMSASVLYWTRASYRKQESEITADALPAAAIQADLKKLMTRWKKRFAKEAPDIVHWFYQSHRRYLDTAMKDAFRAAGITVKFKLTRAERAALRSIIIENTRLIKSIPDTYFDKIQSATQRAVQAGRDMASLTEELKSINGVTRNRAIFISRDQTNKATETLQRERDKELGITEAVWVHIPGRKSARESHMRMDGKRFKLSEGLYDSAEGRNVQCGELPGCMCTYRPIIPDYSDMAETRANRKRKRRHEEQTEPAQIPLINAQNAHEDDDDYDIPF